MQVLSAAPDGRASRLVTAPVLKTGEAQALGGSTPLPSATQPGRLEVGHGVLVHRTQVRILPGLPTTIRDALRVDRAVMCRVANPWLGLPPTAAQSRHPQPAMCPLPGRLTVGSDPLNVEREFKSSPAAMICQAVLAQQPEQVSRKHQVPGASPGDGSTTPSPRRTTASLPV